MLVLVGMVSPSAASNIISLPLAFVRSGYINLNLGNVLYAVYETTLRSRSSVSDTDAYYLYSNPTAIDTSGSGAHYASRPLRYFCMLEENKESGMGYKSLGLL